MAHSIENRNLFLDDDDRKEFLFRFEKKLKECDFQCYAWALMDNHYHLFIRINHLPLSKLMRGLNGGYAQYYNKKYKRRGYLFQNRFQSVLCQDQQYAIELVRYIHLNPLRAGKVKTLQELETWEWCGHGALIGNQSAIGANFQNRQDCLLRFGDNEKDAVHAYLKYLSESYRCEDVKKAGCLGDAEAAEITGSYKGRPAVIGDPDFVRSAMEQYALCLHRNHRKSDYPVVLNTIAKRISTGYELMEGELFKRGRKNKRTQARAAFCYESHNKEFIPLSVIASYLQMTISPVAALIKKGTPQ
jgi:REP element-mobilizing transposase RayT